MRRPSALPTAAALAAATLLASCGSPLLYVEVVVPELQISLPDQAFPAWAGLPVPGAECSGGEQNCLTHDLPWDFADSVPFIGEDNVEVDLRLTGLALSLDAGASDLSGVQSVTIKIVNPDDPSDYSIAASYVRPDPLPAEPITSFAVSGNSNLDLGEYLQGTSFVARAELVYDAPTPAFTATVDAEFSVTLKMDYGSYVF